MIGDPLVILAVKSRKHCGDVPSIPMVPWSVAGASGGATGAVVSGGAKSGKWVKLPREDVGKCGKVSVES